MAEFTPNLNLYKMQITDEMQETFQQYGANADKLDTEITNLKTRPYLEANKTDVATIQPSTWTKIINHTLVENSGGGTWSSGTFTAPSTGIYAVYLGTNMAGIVAGASQYSAVYVNGVLSDGRRIDQRQNSGTNDAMMYGTVILRLIAGDTLDSWVFHSDTVARNLNFAYLRIIKLA